MKRKFSILVVGLFAALFAFTGFASAAQPGQAISFSMGHPPFYSSFCNGDGCLSDVTADFNGRLSDSDELSNLAGTLQIGASPFGNTSRHLTIKAPGQVPEVPFESFDFEACLAGETEPLRFHSRGTRASIIVSLGAGNLKGTGNLAWGTQETCFVDQFGELFVTPPTDFGTLDAELVGASSSGRLFLNGPRPVIGP